MNHLRKLAVNILLLVFSVLIIIFSVEVALRFTSYKQLLSVSVYHFPPYYFEYDKEAGFDIAESFPKTISVFSGEPQTYHVWSNEIGCFDNSCAAVSDYILLAGDSFAWGFAPFEDKWGAIVERFLKERVLKCGVPGYGPKQYLQKIKKVVNRVKRVPKLIIVGYYIENDLADDVLFPRHTIAGNNSRYLVTQAKFTDISKGELKRYNREGLEARFKNLMEYGTEEGCGSVFSAIKSKTRIFLKRHSIIANLAKNSGILRFLGYKAGLIKVEPLIDYNELPLSFIPVDKFPWVNDAWKGHLNNLRQIKDFAQEQNAKLLVVLIPDKMTQVYDFLMPKGIDLDYAQPNRILKEFFAQEGINYIDLLASFKEYATLKSKVFLDAKGDLYWNFDPHFNIKGNRLTGLLVSEYILENNLVDVRDKQRLEADIKEELGNLKRF